MSTIIDCESGSIPVVRETDVLVVGGGPSGICAAVSAARGGANVVLLERASFLGGTATAALVAGFMGFYWGPDVRVTGGIGSEIVERLRSSGGGTDFFQYTLGELTDNPVVSLTFPFDPEALKFVFDDLVSQARVEVVHRVQVAEPIVEDGAVRGVVYQGIWHRRAVRARRTIDASGDGLVALKAGSATTPNPDGFQPMTLMMRVANIDRERVRSTPKAERREIVKTGVRRGKAFYETLAMYPCPTDGDNFLLMTAVNGCDGTDEFGLTAAEHEGRRQVRVTLDYLRENMPGFERAQLKQMAPYIGVRETNRIKGRYVLTEDDVREGREFTDAIAWGGGPLDTHTETGVVLERPRAPFSTPYRALLVDGVGDLAVVGRAASATVRAMSGLRHMGAVMPLGEAAGLAAALSLKNNCDLSGLDPMELRGVLRKQGAIVDRPQAA